MLLPHSTGRFTNAFIYTVTLIISLLLLVNVLLINQNNKNIEKNKRLLEEAEKVKVNTLDIIRNIHQLDMGLRGIALIGAQNQVRVFYEALDHKKILFDSLSRVLNRQGFPMEKFNDMKDSVNLYIDFSLQLKDLIDQNKRDEFLSLLKEDRGEQAWLAFKKYSDEVTAFEDHISSQAQISYQKALQNSFVLQLILFLLAVPTLGYMAYYTTQSMKISEKLAATELEKNELLAKQKERLELMVQERTNKISTQHNELADQNLQLKEAYRIIEEQNKTIQHKNDELAAEVLNQTQDLRKTNSELIEQNGRLEQFAYIISHNLRAPLTRLVGLASLLNMTPDEKEKKEILELIVKSTAELDNVIKDLTLILDIQKLTTKVYSEIILKDLFHKVKTMMEHEIAETSTSISVNFQSEKIYSLPQYIESIFYNLINNAIKYRHPDKEPIITIKSYLDEQNIIIEFTDNGLGMDTEKNKQHLFSLYKRFHFHVEGKGLGLYLVKTQIESLGGTINVKSQLNQGTTFIISIPVN